MLELCAQNSRDRVPGLATGITFGTPERRALDLFGGQTPALAAAAHALTWAALCVGGSSSAHAHTPEATALLDGVGDATLGPHAELLGPLAWVQTQLGDLSSAGRHLARARTVVDRSEHGTALPHLPAEREAIDPGAHTRCCPSILIMT